MTDPQPAQSFEEWYAIYRTLPGALYGGPLDLPLRTAFAAGVASQQARELAALRERDVLRDAVEGGEIVIWAQAAWIARYEAVVEAARVWAEQFDSKDADKAITWMRSAWPTEKALRAALAALEEKA